MKVQLDITKSLEENAADYFETAKKARKKIDGVNKTLAEFEQKHKQEKKQKQEFVSSITKLKDNKQYWYEKFKWFVTSEGFLVIAARDATSNEIIIKKHTLQGDLVFHTDMAGSPFVIIKKDSQEDVDRLFGKDVIRQPEEIGEKSKQEASTFCFAHSRAWKQGLSTADVFCVKPEQVSKEANSGESLAKGAFVIRGDTTYVYPQKEYALGIKTGTNDGDVKHSEPVFLSGPKQAVETYCEQVIVLEQGREKGSEIAKKVNARFREELELDVETDTIVRSLPQGCTVKKERKRKR